MIKRWGVRGEDAARKPKAFDPFVLPPKEIRRAPPYLFLPKYYFIVSSFVKKYRQNRFQTPNKYKISLLSALRCSNPHSSPVFRTTKIPFPTGKITSGQWNSRSYLSISSGGREPKFSSDRPTTRKSPAM